MTPPSSGLANAAGAQRREVTAHTRLYRGGKLVLEGFPAADISEHLADESVTIWLDLRGPGRDELAVLSEEFGLHPLAVESALRHGQRPKLDRYRSHLFLTAYAVRLDTGTGVPYPGFGQKAGPAASTATIALTGLILYLVFKRKNWL